MLTEPGRDPLPAGFIDGCAAVIGADRIVTAATEMAPYEVDFWQAIAGRAAGVLRPRTTEEVAALMALAHQHRVAVVPQGGNTGLVGGGVPDAQRPAGRAQPGRARRASAPWTRAGEWLVAEAGCTLASIQAAADAADRLFPLEPRQRGHLPDRRQPLQQCRRGQRDPLRHGARAGARARGGPGRRQGAGTACAPCARTIPATT